jgi:DNA repair ATPase RecN
MSQDNGNYPGILAASAINAGLDSAKVQLAVIRAAYLISLEGISRATAAQICQSADSEFSTSVTPAFTGVTLIGAGIGKTTTHGKSRFVLDAAQLEDVANRIETYSQQLADKLAATISRFADLPAQIDSLQAEWQKILKLEARKQELLRLTAQYRQQLTNVPHLEDERKSLQQDAQRALELERDVKALAAKIKEMPSLEQKKATLDDAIRKYNADEAHLRTREDSLGAALRDFKTRNAWVDLQTLFYNVQLKQQELEQVSKLLGEKRTLLDRLLNSNREGGN